MDIGQSQTMATREVQGGLIEITLDPIDNVWRMKLHTQIQRRGHTDENDITNFGNVIFEQLFNNKEQQLAKWNDTIFCRVSIQYEGIHR